MFEKVLSNVRKNSKVYKNKALLISIYIVVYEAFIDKLKNNFISIVCPLKEVITMDDIYDIKNCDLHKEVINKEYRNKNKDKIRSFLMWFIENDVFDKSFENEFLTMRKLRNEFVHEFNNVLIYKEYQESYYKKLSRLIEEYENLDNWYYLNFEASIQGQDISNINDKVKSVEIIILKELLNEWFKEIIRNKR